MFIAYNWNPSPNQSITTASKRRKDYVGEINLVFSAAGYYTARLTGVASPLGYQQLSSHQSYFKPVFHSQPTND